MSSDGKAILSGPVGKLVTVPRVIKHRPKESKIPVASRDNGEGPSRLYDVPVSTERLGLCERKPSQ